MSEFGDLYIPLGNGVFYRDEFYFWDNNLYAINYCGLNMDSPKYISSAYSVEDKDSRITEVINEVFGNAIYCARVVFRKWRDFDAPKKSLIELNDLWPFTYGINKKNFQGHFEPIPLRSERNEVQKRRIIREAKKEFRFFGTAGSEELINIDSYLNRLKENQTLKIEFNLSNAISLEQTCKRELDALKRRDEILENLHSENDTQAKSKYLISPPANFGRAALDTLCVLRAIELFLNDERYESLASRISLRLFNGPPSFRGTITDKEIAYVTTSPWEPGMIGNLNVHRLNDENKIMWISYKKEFEDEIENRMQPRYVNLAEAYREFEDAAIRAIHESSWLRTGKGMADKSQLEGFIQSIRYVNRKKDTNPVESLIRNRSAARDYFKEVFYCLDEKVDELKRYASMPQTILEKVKKRYGPVDVAILTALPDELDAVREVFGLPEMPEGFVGTRPYWRSTITLNNGRIYEIGFSSGLKMGNLESSSLTENIIRDLKPRAVFLVGISAATQQSLKIGDVVVGEFVLYYEKGKETPEGKKQEPYIIDADEILLSKAKYFPKWHGVVSVPRPGNSKRNSKVHFGGIASGEEVIADAKKREEIQSLHRKVLAIEMEGYGFSHAALRATSTTGKVIRAIVIKAIVDRGDKKKNDRWRHYACHAPVEFLKYFLELDPLEME